MAEAGLNPPIVNFPRMRTLKGELAHASQWLTGCATLRSWIKVYGYSTDTQIEIYRASTRSLFLAVKDLYLDESEYSVPYSPDGTH